MFFYSSHQPNSTSSRYCHLTQLELTCLLRVWVGLLTSKVVSDSWVCIFNQINKNVDYSLSGVSNDKNRLKSLCVKVWVGLLFSKVGSAYDSRPTSLTLYMWVCGVFNSKTILNTKSSLLINQVTSAKFNPTRIQKGWTWIQPSTFILDYTYTYLPKEIKKGWTQILNY